MAKFCRFCGKPVKENAKFCENCGKSLAKASAAPVPPVCPRCGEPLAPDVVFCGNCGLNLQQGTGYASAVPEPTVSENWQQDWNPAQNQQQGWAPQQPQGREYPQQQGWAQPQPQPGPNVRETVQAKRQGRSVSSLLQGSGSRKMLLAAAAAVILLVVGITGFWKPGFLLDLFRSTAKLENGVLALNDISLDFKKTNLKNGAATLATVKDKEEEVHNGLIGDLYVMKIDKNCQGKVTVTVPVPKGFKPTTGNGRYIKLGIGRDYALANGKTARFYEYFDATVKEGKVVAVIDPAASGRSRHKSKTEVKPAEDKAPDVGKFTEYVGLFYKEGIVVYGEGYQNSKGHFRLWYPYSLKPGNNVFMGSGDAQRLLSDLEEAYNYYKTHGYADHVDTFTPIDVYVSSSEDDGGWNFLSGNMELSERKMFGDNLKLGYEGERRKYTKTTIYHEFFHAVQQSMIDTYKKKGTLWFDEATSTHFEKVITPSGITPNGLENFHLLWQGLIPKQNTQEEGYARGLLIDYMSSKLKGDAWIRKVYEYWDAKYWRLKADMRLIAGTEADFAADFYMEVIKNYGRKQKSVENYFYKFCRKPSPSFGEDHFLSAIKLQLDDKTKEKIIQDEKNGRPISIKFTSDPLELEGYGGYVVALAVPEKQISKDTVVNLAEGFPEKCQLKLDVKGECRIQLIKFKRGDTKNIVSSKSSVIENFKEQTKNNYTYLVLVTSTKPTKQEVVLQATLSKDGKEKNKNKNIPDKFIFENGHITTNPEYIEYIEKLNKGRTKW